MAVFFVAFRRISTNLVVRTAFGYGVDFFNFLYFSSHTCEVCDLLQVALLFLMVSSLRVSSWFSSAYAVGFK